MSVFVDLVALYENGGFEVQSSLSPAHFPGFNHAELPFTYIYGDDGRTCQGGGIALAEIAFFEALCERARPNRIFIVGNAFGWSTLALAAINRQARVVAIDHCLRPDEAWGIEVTNRLARAAGLDARAVKGKSPDDVDAICSKEFDGPVDFVFIDGGHTNAQQTLDFEACSRIAAPSAIYILHDVVNFGLMESFNEIAHRHPDLVANILFRTPSGMGVCYPTSRREACDPVVAAFTESEVRFRTLRAEGQRRIAESSKA